MKQVIRIVTNKNCKYIKAECTHTLGCCKICDAKLKTVRAVCESGETGIRDFKKDAFLGRLE